MSPCSKCGLPLGDTKGANGHGFGDCAPECWCYAVCWSAADGECWSLCRACHRALDGCPHGRGGLHLTRRFGEALWIGDARVTIQRGPGSNQIRVQIQAPASIAIHREEAAERERKDHG